MKKVARALAALLLLLPVAAGADTVASLLGNFTVNQYCGLHLADAGRSLSSALRMAGWPLRKQRQ